MTTGASLTKVALDEYTKFIKHAELLIFKDSLIADNAETTESAIRGNLYTSAKLGLLFDDNKLPVSEADRDRIIANYEAGTWAIYNGLKDGLAEIDIDYTQGEINPYYRDLFCEKSVDITTARLAGDFEIIYESNLKLVESFRQLFRAEYTANLVYFKKVLFTHGFGNDSQGYRSFVRFFVAWMTIESSIDKVKGPPALNIELMDEWAVRNMMYSFGVYFLDDLSLAHQKTILVNLMELLRNKGSDRVFTTILSIFGFQDIEAFRYYLIKDYEHKEDGVTKDFSKPDIFFMKVPYEEQNFENFLNTMTTQEREALKRNYHTVTGGDSTWKVTKDEVETMEFNAIQTKYFDIQSAMEVMKISTQMALFSNMMRTIRHDRPLDDAMYFVSVEVVEAPISVFDALIALNILATEILGYEAVIPSSESQMRSVWSFPASSDYDNMSDEYKAEFNATNFMGAQDIPGMLDYRNVVPAFEDNIEIKDRMEILLSQETDYDAYRKLQSDYGVLFMSEQMDNVFEGHATYMDFIKSRNESLYDFLQAHIDDISDDHTQVLRKAFNAIAVSLENYVNSIKFRPTSFNTDYILTFVKRMINTFKAYTVQLNDISIYYKIDGPINTIKLFDSIRGWDAKFGKADLADLTDDASTMGVTFSDIDGFDGDMDELVKILSRFTIKEDCLDYLKAITQISSRFSKADLAQLETEIVANGKFSGYDGFNGDMKEVVKILHTFTKEEDFMDYLVELVKTSSTFALSDLVKIQHKIRSIGNISGYDSTDLYEKLTSYIRNIEVMNITPSIMTTETFTRSLAGSFRATQREMVKPFSGINGFDKAVITPKVVPQSARIVSDRLQMSEHFEFEVLGVDEILLLKLTEQYTMENQVLLTFDFPRDEMVVLTLEHFWLDEPTVRVNDVIFGHRGVEAGNRYKVAQYDIELVSGENTILIDKTNGYDMKLIQLSAFRGDGSTIGFIQDDTIE